VNIFQKNEADNIVAGIYNSTRQTHNPAYSFRTEWSSYYRTQRCFQTFCNYYIKTV